jgi:hypothetical protein
MTGPDDLHRLLEQRGLTSVEGAFALDAMGTTTRVTESVVLRCPFWLSRFVLREATRAQEALLANLKRRIEASH